MKQILCVLLPLCLLRKQYFTKKSFCCIILMITALLTTPAIGQSRIPVKGKVISMPDYELMPGVNVFIKGTTRGVITDANGEFFIEASMDETLVFSFIGYKTKEIPVTGETSLTIEMESDVELLDEVAVYSTGYQELPDERATGSFENIDEELINRSTSTDIISRLEGISNSLLFDSRNINSPGSSPPSLRIRGLGSMYGEGFSGVASSKESPLIIVDNFPYEGDINNINPNDVESITILKDAAASSIWGARAGNGVIVITTKKGITDQPVQVSFNSNITINEKPDLYYNPSFLNSAEMIGFEKQLFDQGFYDGDISSPFFPALSGAVNLMSRHRDSLISDAELEAGILQLEQNDIRRDAEKYLYQNQVNRQYSLNMRGGSRIYKYYLAAGFDKNQGAVIGDNTNRITLTSNNTISPNEKLTTTFGIYYAQNNSEQNGMDLGRLYAYSRLPYLSLADENGNPASIPYGFSSNYIEDPANEGLLDWRLYPLMERELQQNTIKEKETRINTEVNYTLLKGLDFDLKYQYQNIIGERTFLTERESYVVRNQVNRFTQADGSTIFPYGAMLSSYHSQTVAHMGRGQLNYNSSINSKHNIAALAGAEIRENRYKQQSFELIGYDSELLTYQSQFDYLTRYPVRPIGSSRIPLPNNYLDELLDRYLSYYGNASYTYDERYLVTGSLRWDGSNLFGVKTNQKGVPLWSVGGGWIIDNEAFYNFAMLDRLKLRATYGVSGNIDKSATAYPTISYGTDRITDLPYGRIISPGNPQLRWEKIKTFNVAIDFATAGNKISGSIEYFNKNSTDLIAPVPLDPTTGFLDRYNINYAGLEINGIDAELNTRSYLGPVIWESNTIVNYTKDRVTEFDFDGEGNPNWYTQGNLTLPVVGEPLYTLYSYPWIGLDANTGDPLVRVDDQEGTDYNAYFDQLDPSEGLIAHGPKIPPLFGSFRNSFSWKGFGLSANVTWKAGYYFRRDALDYYQLFNNYIGHEEYINRWQEPGDHLITNIPSMPENPNVNRDKLYTLSEITVEKGDHIRLQDISLSYEIMGGAFNFSIEKVKIYLYARNIGIIWRANDKGLDPDYPSSLYPPMKSIAGGIQINF
ncbi:MAG: SusC/RagA family TonB-linked outer membrane protein [Candidatus Cyclobacteriaceae bacterium M2_1C_046]